MIHFALGSHESYVRAILAPACAPVEKGGLGYRAVVVNFRACKLPHLRLSYELPSSLSRQCPEKPADLRTPPFSPPSHPRHSGSVGWLVPLVSLVIYAGCTACLTRPGSWKAVVHIAANALRAKRGPVAP